MDLNKGIQGASFNIGIFGTGHFGVSLSNALNRCGHNVCIGSRNPELETNQEVLDKIIGPGLTVTGIKECAIQSDIIFMAVEYKHMFALLKDISSYAEEKIFVDISNTTQSGRLSTTETLSKEFPLLTFVKAFNNIPANDLADLSNCERKLIISSNNIEASNKICAIANTLGFSSIQQASLKYTKEMELEQNRTFGKWSSPLSIALVIFLTWLIYGSLRHHLVKEKPWKQLPMNTLNKIFGATAMTILPLCYLPGSIAKSIKLISKTKHMLKYPILIKWLEMRKYLGLIALWVASVHCLLSVAHLSPAYFNKWYASYKITIPGNHTEDDLVFVTSLKMKWYGELCILLGVLAFGAMVVIGLTSINSIGSKMNNQQWMFVHSWLGHTCLLIATVHVTVKAVPSWPYTRLIDILQGISFITLVLPYLTLLLRIILVIATGIMKVTGNKMCANSSAEDASKARVNDPTELEQLTV